MLKNGIVWKDTQGNPIHAHGGYMIYRIPPSLSKNQK